MFTVEFLKKEKVKAMREKNKAAASVVTLILGDLQTKRMTKEGVSLPKKNEAGVMAVVAVSDEEYIENLLSKLKNSITSNVKIYTDRKDQVSLDKANAEIAYISDTFFPPLSEDFILEKSAEFKASGKSKKEFMEYLKENYFGRYNGGFAAKSF